MDVSGDRPKLEEAVDLVCLYASVLFRVDYQMVRHSRRRCKKPIADARMAAAHVIRLLYGDETRDELVGDAIGRHRSTITHAHEEIERRREECVVFDRRVELLEEAFLAFVDLYEATAPRDTGSDQMRQDIRRERDRRRKRAARFRDGIAKYGTGNRNPAFRKKPWETLGIPRSTWFRMKATGLIVDLPLTT